MKKEIPLTCKGIPSDWCSSKKIEDHGIRHKPNPTPPKSSKHRKRKRVPPTHEKQNLTRVK